jgi:2'-5' RNA ligase
MKNDSLRLFIALWPDDATRDAIAAFQHSWDWPREASRTRPERLHVTLHFIGDVARERVPALAAALQVRFEPFELDFTAARVWPGGIAALEPAVVPQPLADLHARLGDALRGVGLSPETRPYRPHVTLARRARRAMGPQPDGIAWRVRVPHVLVQSLPGGHGYVALHQY